MTFAFKTMALTNVLEEKDIVLPKDSQIFDIFKNKDDFGTDFTICYSYSIDEISTEKFKLHMIPENRTSEIKHKLRYLGRYNQKFSSGSVFVFLQVAP